MVLSRDTSLSQNPYLNGDGDPAVPNTGVGSGLPLFGCARASRQTRASLERVPLTLRIALFMAIGLAAGFVVFSGYPPVLLFTCLVTLAIFLYALGVGNWPPLYTGSLLLSLLVGVSYS